MDLPTTPQPPLDDPTRVKLLAALSELRRAAPTDELARELGLHVNGVRRHLERLEEAGFVERDRVVRGQGRPRDEWSISDSAWFAPERPTAYADLANWLARSIPPTKWLLREVEGSGRGIGRELAPEPAAELDVSLRHALSSFGFDPRIEPTEGGLRCTLGNCPYRTSAEENRDLICGLHRGVTVGLLEELAPGAKLVRFEPNDPARAGCVIEVATGECH